ncbi:MAG: right-handed parallel beta-helix repeat-containing protein [Clostridia bacterium]|nr:right-handed parallel beta-helix repeat-containing protein [Clostridia bacterium]
MKRACLLFFCTLLVFGGLLSVHAEAADQSFTFLFSPDGAERAAGQYGAVTVLEAMSDKGKTVTVDGVVYPAVQGSNNPKTEGSNAKGSVPDGGAAVSVTAPADGVITVYGVNGTNSGDGTPKTFWVVPVGGEAYTVAKAGEIAVKYTAKAGETVWFYAAGSKFQYGAVTFVDAAFAPAEDPSAQDERPWQFVRFGPSTSDAANRAEDGADIAESVTLYSCTFDANGDIVKKGGKFVADAPADGESFYYTTIDPTQENFCLMADVTVDYLNPTPDGQEGFALMLRDSISGSGSYYSNTVSVAASKLRVSGKDTKGVLGTRNYSGIVSNEDAAKNAVVETRLAFTADPEDLVTQGTTYRVCLEKTSSAYITRQYAINEDGSTGDLLGEHIQYIPAKDPEAVSVSSYAELDDPMCVQEPNTAYLALVTARGINATFSNISFTVSPWKAEEWKVQPTSYVKTQCVIRSGESMAEEDYRLVFRTNADGVADVMVDEIPVAQQIPVTANEEVKVSCPVSTDMAVISVAFTPDADFAFSRFEKLESYDTKTALVLVFKRTLGKDGTIYVTPEGKENNGGTSFEDAVNLQTALNYAAAGQTVLLKSGVYEFSYRTLNISRGRDGTQDAPIVLTTDGGFATLDFKGTGMGFSAAGDWWHMSRLNICNTAPLEKGMTLSGSHNVLESMNFYNNGTTGLQLSGSSSDTIAAWPAHNTVINCTAMNNGDPGYEDADGFAPKLTCGEGNVFIGCIAAYNADDGWDLFAKSATGPIGKVEIRGCAAYRNGYLMVKPGSTKSNILFADIAVDENGSLSFTGEDITAVEAGNGNGFKLGGTNIPGGHRLINSIAWENKQKGIDANSCPDVKVYDCTSFNNGSHNIALYTGSKDAKTGYEAEGVLSFRTGAGAEDNLKLQKQSSFAVYNDTNHYWPGSGDVSADWFLSLDTSVIPTRLANGGIDMHDLLLLTEEARTHDSGAQGAAWGQPEAPSATIWVVGDSTVSAFEDQYYIPRQGWGEQLERYLNAQVYNLARSGASSKDFTTMPEYRTLLSGSEDIPAMGNTTGESFLLIGFGHNDQKTEAARFTSPVGDYLTEGSFANSLYTNYILPAQTVGVTPVLVTPIARLTDENTTQSYQSESGHITEDTVIDGTTYPGGDYAQAIRELAASLQLPCIDLTAATIELNVSLGAQAQWLHAFNGAKRSGEGEELIPAALDKTHTSSYGAKMHAWLIAGEALFDTYRKPGREAPTYEKDFAASVNPDYVPADYQPPVGVSANWPAFTDGDGRVWNGTVFGDVGGESKILSGSFTAEAEDSKLTLGVADNCGKISSATDGFIFYYTALPADACFTLTATATVNDLFGNNQMSFGLMARDDLYLDTYVKETMGDYVAAGSRNQGAVNCFGRRSGELVDGPDAKNAYKPGDTVSLTLSGTADGFTLQYGDHEPVSAGFDYRLTTIDPDHIYVGFYAVRNANVTFSDIHLTLE